MMCTVLSGLLEIFGVSLKPPLAFRSLASLAPAHHFENDPQCNALLNMKVDFNAEMQKKEVHLQL